MATIRYELDPDGKLHPDEIARLQKLAETLKDHIDEYDEDCPPLTKEQLAELKSKASERRKHA